MFSPTQFAKETTIVFRRSRLDGISCGDAARRLVRDRIAVAVAKGREPITEERADAIISTLAYAARSMASAYRDLSEEWAETADAQEKVLIGIGETK